MIDHTGIGVADVSRSATFYDAVLETLGMRRVIRYPITSEPTALATVSTTPSSGLIDTTHTLSNSIPPLQPKAGLRSTHSTPPPSRQAGPKTVGPGCANRITTPRLCWIQMVTTSRRSSVATQANSKSQSG